MRYDDYDDYRPSRGGSKRSSSYSGGRDYDRYERGSRSGYDRGSYDRGGYDRYDSYDNYEGYDDYADRYGSSRRRYEDDFDAYDWERTAPDWDDRGSSRKRRSGGSSQRRSSSSGRRSSGGSSSRSRDRDRDRDRNRSRDRDRDRDRSRDRDRDRDRSRNWDRDRRDRSRGGGRPPKKQGINIVPIILGLILIIVAIFLVKNVLGGSRDKYEITFSNQTIVVGETATATISGIPSGQTPTVTWTSNDTTVVSIDDEEGSATATITAKAVGRATIAATIDDTTVSGTVNVVETAPGVVSITLSQDEVEIKSGDTYTIQATVNMESSDMSPAKITWTSNDASVARVSDDGVITARDVGSTIIKGTAGEKTVELVVKVVENPNATNHDATQTTGQEPEEGATTDGTSTENRTTEDTTTTGGDTADSDNETEGGGDSQDLGSDITGESPAN